MPTQIAPQDYTNQLTAFYIVKNRLHALDLYENCLQFARSEERGVQTQSWSLIRQAHVTMIQQLIAETVPEDVTCHVLFHAFQRNFEP